MFKDEVFKVILSCCVLFLAACAGPNDANKPIGTDQVTGSPQPIPLDPANGAANPSRVTDPTSLVGPSCHSNNPDNICLALKYVVYKKADSTGIVSSQEATQNVVEMNALWSQCKIGFEIDEFEIVDSTQYGFLFNTNSQSELSSIRSRFEDDKTLLVVTTGTWTGSLGALAANAWTMMPGSSINGVVLEQPVAKSPKLIAHELGHYLNLDHVNDVSNMMNPVIYPGSTALSSSQCSAARSAAKYYWSAMYR